MATKEDLSLAQVAALVRLSKKLKNAPAPKQGEKGEKGSKGEKGEKGPKGEKGEEGKEGEKGTQILSGKSKPEDKEGNDGDFYIQKSPLTLFGPKREGKWGSGIQIAKKEEKKDSKTSELTIGGQLPGSGGGGGGVSSATVAIGTVTTGDVSAILPSGTVSSSAQVSQPIIIGQFGNYATAVQGPNADYHFGHDQGIHAGIWSNTTTDPSVISAEYQHIGIVAPYDMKNVCAKVAVRGQSGADPAFWIYTGSFLENNNGNTNLGWAASSSAANYNGHSTIQGNRTNAMFSCNITGSDSFNLKENDLMMFYITNQENNSKSIRIMATIYGEKE